MEAHGYLDMADDLWGIWKSVKFGKFCGNFFFVSCIGQPGRDGEIAIYRVTAVPQPVRAPSLYVYGRVSVQDECRCLVCLGLWCPELCLVHTVGFNELRQLLQLLFSVTLQFQLDGAFLSSNSGNQ